MTVPVPVVLSLPDEPTTKDTVLTIIDGENANHGFVRETEAAAGSQAWTRNIADSGGTRYSYTEIWHYVLTGGGTRVNVSAPSPTNPYPFPWSEQPNGTVADAQGKIVPLEIIVRQANLLNQEGIPWER